MVRSYGQILCVAITVSLPAIYFCQRCGAAEPPPVDVSDPASDESLLTQSASGGYVRFYWCGGLLRLDPPMHRKGSADIQTETMVEHLSVTAERGLPSAMYRLTRTVNGLKTTVRMDVVDAESIDLCIRQCGGDSVTVHQKPAGDVTVSWVRGKESGQCTGATWLHLYKNCQRKVPPSLWQFVDRLVPRQPLWKLVGDAEDALVRRPASGFVRRADVQRAVDQLRSPRRMDRSDAHSRLLSWGIAAVVHLNQMPSDQWDAEQLATVQSICRRVRLAREDYPGSLAAQLANDPEYRNRSLDESSDPSRLRIASSRN